MANPNPQHNPTDGLNVAAYVQLTGTNLSNRANGGLTVATEATANDTTGLNGQGFGAVGNIANRPNAQYELVLSLAGKTYGGTVYANTCQLTVVLKDVAGTTYTPVGSPVYFSSADPANKAGAAPAWYSPSNFAGYDPNVASVSSSGLITARALGQAIIEVQFPTFDNTLSSPQAGGTYPANTPGTSGTATPQQSNPNEMIYAQVVVNVVA